MQASLLLLLAVSGVTTVQFEAVHILGQNYEHKVSALYHGEAPSLINFTNVNSSIVVFLNGVANDLGAQFLNEPVPVIPLTPYPVYNFTNNLQNVLTCKDDLRNNCNQRAYFNISNIKFMVSTGDLPYIVQCHGDVNGQRVFIVAGKERSSSVGKLYAVNTLDYKRVHFWIAAEEVARVGDRISAVAVSQTNGDILISEESIISGQKGFRMVLLKPLAGIKEFTAAVTQSKEAIFKQLDINLRIRINELNIEVSRMRDHVTQDKLYHRISDVPRRGRVINGSYEDSLKEVINDLSKKMLQLYKENVLGELQLTGNNSCNGSWFNLYARASEQARLLRIQPQFSKNYLDPITQIPTVKCLDVKSEYALCASNETFEQLESKYREYEKLVRFSLKFLIKATESRKSILQNLGIEYTKINILGQVYRMYTERIYYIDAPSSMDYMSNISSLVIFIKNYGYTTGRYFGEFRAAKWYTPQLKDYFMDMYGNEVKCKDGRGYIKVHGNTTYSVPTLPSESIVQCVGDFKRSRVFFLSRDLSHNVNGKVFAVSTKKLMETLKITVQEIYEVGKNITALAVQSSSGIIYLSREITTANRLAFGLLVLYPALDEVTKLVTDSTTERPLPNSTDVIDGDEFLYAVREGEQIILNLYEKNWKSKVDSVISEYEKLNELEKVYGQKQQRPISLSTEAILAVVDRSNVPLNETLRYIFDELLYKYIKNIVGLPEKSLQRLKLARMCPTLLNFFRDKMIDEIPAVFDKFPKLGEVSSPGLLEPGLRFYNKDTCPVNNTDISCVLSEQITKIKTNHDYNELYLKQLHEYLTHSYSLP